MKKKKLNQPVMTVVVMCKHGYEVRSTMSACKAKELFAWYVQQYLGSYSYAMREIQLLDNAGRVFQSFKMHF